MKLRPRGALVLRVAWSVALLAFAIHALVAARGPVPLNAHFGPDPVMHGDALRFAVLGDTHAHVATLRTALRTAADRGCAFLIQLGDFVDYGDDLEFRRAAQLFNRTVPALPVYLVRGNHENTAPDGTFTERYCHYVPTPYYSFTVGPHLFCVLDTSEEVWPQTQRRWLDDVFAAAGERAPLARTFLFAHVPPDVSGFNSTDLPDEHSRALLATAAQHGVTALFAGHFHGYHERLGDGQPDVLITGCGGGSLRAPSTDVHYVEVTLRGAAIGYERVPLPRASRWSTAVSYAWDVLVPRYRAWCMGAVGVLLIWEWRHLAAHRPRKLRAVPEARA